MQTIQCVYRNPGHWDFYSGPSGRQFRLRGSGSTWYAIDERLPSHREVIFKTFTSALNYITEQLMFENLEPDGTGNNKVV